MNAEIPEHAAEVSMLVETLGAMVVASPGTPHVTVVHEEGHEDTIDTILLGAGYALDRIDYTRVKVFSS